MTAEDSAVNRVRESLASRGLDAVVAASPENVLFTAGTSFMTQRMIPDRLALVVISPNTEPEFIYCTIEANSAREESWLTKHRGYKEHAERPMAVLADALRNAGLDKDRIGVESKFLVKYDYDELAEALPQATLVPADSLFDEVRAIKTPQEIEVLGAAALATDAAIVAAFSQAHIGMTEDEVAQMLLSEGRSRGGGRVLHLVLVTGANNHKVHSDPGKTPLQAGSVLRTDFGMTWGKYNSDVARTAFIAPLSPRQEADYLKLEEIHQQVIAAMKPGVRASEIFNLCQEAFAKTGLDFWVPHIGHSLGLGLHEKPMLQPYDQTELKPGMVFMVEPAITTEDGLYHTEDMVEITTTGSRILSRSGDWSRPMVIS